MAKETILQINSVIKEFYQMFSSLVQAQKIWGNTLPDSYRFPMDKTLASPNGVRNIFVKVNHFSVKFGYYYFCHSSTLELLFHMLENLKMYMKITKFLIYADLTSYLQDLVFNMH